MATSKTLTPTNVTIYIPDFTDSPDQRVNSDCLDKEADAINALNSKTSTAIAQISGSTRAEILANIDALVSGSGQAFFYMASSISALAGLESQTYFCTLACMSANVRVISATRGGTADVITLQKSSSGWASNWISINSNLATRAKFASSNIGANGTMYFNHSGAVVLFTDRGGMWTEGNLGRTLATIAASSSFTVTRESNTKIKIVSSNQYTTMLYAIGDGDTFGFSST